MSLKSYQVGFFAERFAINHLWVMGFYILECRKKTPYGEIDIICSKGKRIMFCEVKFGKNVERATSSIKSKQMIRIVNAANYWLSQNQEYSNFECSFCAIIVIQGKPILYIPNAWQLD
ncbi:YraN family protein [Candidatus Gromoviella agglomerans]|uniref:YraN family protein n=1 Tax=Candidatus Gromoviella agglomerans TaxID=2806609 RepID=UPI001E35C717|nr:YraN family protein [Candidatus Gromoviella agglomerans]UFX98478.1 YraN family protein [Candidatus Gromoviella agglomerans]